MLRYFELQLQRVWRVTDGREVHWRNLLTVGTDHKNKKGSAKVRWLPQGSGVSTIFYKTLNYLQK